MNNEGPSIDPPAAAHILIVDDDCEIRHLLSNSLDSHGYKTSVAADTRQMDKVLAMGTVDAIILDIMMPGEGGLDACRRLSGSGGPVIIFLSAMGDETDRILGLELGASYYLPKPCSAREVLATVRAALRSRQVGEGGKGHDLCFAGWQLKTASWELLDPRGILIDLTDGEFAILRAFAERPRRVLTREQLLDYTRGPETESYDRAIDVQISRLRRKIGTGSDDMIRTIRNEGYMFVPSVMKR